MASLNVLLLPEPGSGHLMSLIEAGKRLLGHGAGGGDGLGREFTVTVLVVRPPTPESAAEVGAHVRRVAESGIAGVRFHHLPAVEPPADCAGNLQEFKSRYLELHRPHVEAAARELGAATKFSSNGTVLWQKTYGGTAGDELLAIAEVNGTGFVLAGKTDSYGNGMSDFWVVRIDPSGDTLWTRTIGTNLDEEGYDVVTTQDGGFAVYGNENFITGDAMLVKLNAAGAPQWTQLFDGGAGRTDLGHSLVETWDGGFALAGRKENPINYNHVWLIRTDATGALIWDRIFPRDLFSNGEDLVQTADLGFLITGYTGNQSGDPGNLYMIKTESAGYVGVHELATTAFDFVLGTNSATATLTLRFDEAVSGREIRITNMEGKEILFLREEELLVEISTSGWARGVYVANVVSGTAVASRKFVVN